MATAEPLTLLEPHAYLAMEQQSDIKHEYVNGLIIAMAGASRRHNLITLALASKLRSHLRGTGCQTFASDMKVNASHKSNNVFYYPDVMVSCNRQNTDNYVENHPQIIIEVLSPSTEARDRMEKLAAYTAIPSLKEYILVHQDKIAVDLYQNTDAGWEVIRLTHEQEVAHLVSIDLSITLQEIYEDVVGVL